MNQYFLEYIWLDGSNPQQVRSKSKIVYAKSEDKIKLSNWNFDGSSTNQAETSKSELILVPVNKFKNPFRFNGFLIMCEVYDINMDPHPSNKRSELTTLVESDSLGKENYMFGFEQEYIIFDQETGKPIGWPKDGFPRPQGDYYCGVGGNNVSGREFVEHHASLCLNAGLKYSGTNAEVMLGQWEYQIGPVYGLDGSDQLWISRWILDRLSEDYGYYIEYHPKPFTGNEWNGSGMHVNFSTSEMRTDLRNKKSLAIEACQKLSENVKCHIDVYGKFNDLRLTGSNETCSIDEFRWGIGDRTASVRIPSSINDDVTPGYIEDRRPASNADPYEICYQLINTTFIKVDSNSVNSDKKKRSISSVVSLFALIIILLFPSCKSESKVSNQLPTNEEEVIVPCSGSEYFSNNRSFRSSGFGESQDQAVAKKKALSNSRAYLASSIDVTVKSVIDNYVNSREFGNKEEVSERFESLVREVVEQKLKGSKIICEKMSRSDTGTYKYYVSIEMESDVILDSYTDRVSKDDRLRIDYDYEKFKSIFDSEMSK